MRRLGAVLRPQNGTVAWRSERMHPKSFFTDDGTWRNRMTVAGLILLALGVQIPLFDRGIVPMDEGHLAAAADWMLDGKRLYLDIHTGIFPGIYLITSGLFAIFGRDLIVQRAAALVVNGVTVLALWSVARRLTRPALALLPPVLYLALLVLAFPVLSMFNYSTLAVCFGLIALVLLLRYLEVGRPLDGAGVGLCLAAAALTKQNFGGLMFVALFLGLWVARRESALSEKSLLASVLPIGLAGALLTLPVILYFAATGALPALIDATILSLGGSQLRNFNNPIPPIFGPHDSSIRFIFLYSPPAIFNALVHGEPFVGLPVSVGLRSAAIRISYGLPIATLIASFWVLFRTAWRPPGARRAATRVVILFASIFWLGIFPSAIWSHLAFVTTPLLLLVALLADRIGEATQRLGRSGKIALRTTQVFGAGVIAFAMLDVGRSIVRWNPYPLDLERAHMRVSERDLGLYPGAVEFVDDCAAPGDPILALPDIPIIYFLTDRPNPSPYDLTIPGNVDGNVIIDRIRSENVRCIVMNTQMYPEFPPFKQLFPGLARTLEQQFRGELVIQGGNSKWIGLVRREPAEAP